MNNNNRVDKGFELRYWKLSYRRRFIRGLWMLPFCITLLVLSCLTVPTIVPNIIFLIGVVSVLLTDIIYNYLKWKRTLL